MTDDAMQQMVALLSAWFQTMLQKPVVFVYDTTWQVALFSL